MMKKANIQHIIYDVDGLLLNTEPFFTKVAKQICAEFGKKYTFEHKINILGKPALPAAEYLVNALDLPISPENFLQEKDKLLIELFPHSEAMPGAQELTNFLHTKKIPQACGTSATLEMLNIKLKNHQTWFNKFHAIVTADHPEVKHGKPAPDIFLIAAKKINASAESCLVFEDAPSGVAAAKAAGMQVIAVPDPIHDKHHFAKADHIINSLDEFNPSEWINFSIR